MSILLSTIAKIASYARQSREDVNWRKSLLTPTGSFHVCLKLTKEAPLVPSTWSNKDCGVSRSDIINTNIFCLEAITAYNLSGGLCPTDMLLEDACVQDIVELHLQNNCIESAHKNK